MVTVDHGLSGGVISPLYPENGDAVERTTLSSTKENPYRTTCEEVDDEEVYPEKLPSAVLLEMMLKDTLKPLLANNDEPTLWEWETKSNNGDEISYTSEEMPWYDRKPSTRQPPSYKPEVTIQGWVTRPDETSNTTEEELSDNRTTTFDDEASMEEEEYSSESEFTKSDSTYVLSPTAQETKRKMEATLPNSIR